jgi:hypothetical protein
LKISQSFDAICLLHIQGKSISQKETSVKAGGKNFLLGLFLGSEDKGEMLFRNVD